MIRVQIPSDMPLTSEEHSIRVFVVLLPEDWIRPSVFYSVERAVAYIRGCVNAGDDQIPDSTVAIEDELNGVYKFWEYEIHQSELRI